MYCQEIVNQLNNNQITAKIINNNGEFDENFWQGKAIISPQEIEATLEDTVIMPSQFYQSLTTKIDGLLLHPIFGLPLFFLGMFLVFQIVWNVGLPSQDLMEIITNFLQSNLIEPSIKIFPEIIQNFIINGIWNGFATVASFVPLIVLFFIVMAILEDSGYLARAAYLIDALMLKIGLDGRSFVLQMMGFGCNVPALMGTRIMRSKALPVLIA